MLDGQEAKQASLRQADVIIENLRMQRLAYFEANPTFFFSGGQPIQ